MLQQTPFNSSHQDVSRADYSALIDANYAMVHAQAAQAHAQAQAHAAHAHSSQTSTFNPLPSRSKAAEKESLVGGQDVPHGPETWNKGGDWSQLGMSLQPENLSYNANEVFGPQYPMNAAKNYWG